MVEELASYRQCVERIRSNWPTFLKVRKDRMKALDRMWSTIEFCRDWESLTVTASWLEMEWEPEMLRLVGSVLEALFTTVLDWSLSDINYLYSWPRAHLLLTCSDGEHLIVEVMLFGRGPWNPVYWLNHVMALLSHKDYDVTCGRHNAKCVGISDGTMLYVADIEASTLLPHPAHPGPNIERTELQDRIFVSLSDPVPQEDLWWLSVDGINWPCGDI